MDSSSREQLPCRLFDRQQLYTSSASPIVGSGGEFQWVINFLVSRFWRSSFHATTKTPSPNSNPIPGISSRSPSSATSKASMIESPTSSPPPPTLTVQVNGLLGLSHGVYSTDPVVVNHLFHSNISNYVKGLPILLRPTRVPRPGHLNVDAHLWKTQRKIASPEFNTKSLKQFVSDIEIEEIKLFVKYLVAADDWDHTVINAAVLPIYNHAQCHRNLPQIDCLFYAIARTQLPHFLSAVSARIYLNGVEDWVVLC